MTVISPLLPFIGIILCVVLFSVRGALGKLLGLLLRSCCSMVFLALLSKIPFLSSISLGVNPVNALILGVLGVPGFALLLLIRWVLQ